MSPTLLEFRAVTKRFPGVAALSDVSFEIRPGQVHVLFGENGAGKSTIVNLVVGNYVPDEGTLVLDGEPVAFSGPAEARKAGMCAVFQEFSLSPTMTVAQNVMLGQEDAVRGILSPRRIRAAAATIMGDLGFEVDLDAMVRDLSRSEQQMVEIAKALVSESRVLVMDEPTAALTDQEAQIVFEVVERLRDRGIAIIYITHRLNEIFRIGDVVSVFRDGRHIVDRNVSEVTEDELITLMAGREISSVYPTIRYSPGPVKIRLSNASSASFQDANIEVRAGEIVGIAGLAGSGKSEVAAACFGAHRIDPSGTLEVNGQRVRKPSPRKLIDQGVVYLPPDRHQLGLVLDRSVVENTTFSGLGGQTGLSVAGLVRPRRERNTVREIVGALDLRPMNLDAPVRNFSGGNQQKVVFARAYVHDTKTLIVDDPTVGVDVGVRVEIYERLRSMCESGVAVLLVSSDLNEILHLCNRAYVMSHGQITAHLEADTLTEGDALKAFFSSAPALAAAGE